MTVLILILQILSIIGLVVVGWLAKSAQEYAKQKGKNLADKEDIKELTNFVKSVETKYTTEIEHLKAHLQLRGALLEKRLAAHQHVFTLLKHAMICAANYERSTQVRNALEAWMDENCLWLDKQTRESVWEACRAIYPYGEAVRNKLSLEEQSKVFQPLLRAHSLVTASIDLPSVSTAHLDPLWNIPVSQARRNRAQQAAASTEVMA